MSEELSPQQGLLLVDKPVQPTSHDVVKKIRWISGVRRVGHTGTLDPLASGLLILCLGIATRLAEYVTELPKSYLATVRLGQETDTYDAEGRIVSEKPVRVAKNDIEAALDAFRGDISQKPPMFSAVKFKGKPLYKHAREGQEISRSDRSVTVYSIEVTEWISPDLSLRINCSSGTYIRSIAHDLGNSLECGGHISNLRRKAIGDLDVDDAVQLSQISKENWISFLQPSELAVSHLPRIGLTEKDSLSLFFGRPAATNYDADDGVLMRAYDPDGSFVGIVLFENGQLRGKKIFYRPANR